MKKVRAPLSLVSLGVGANACLSRPGHQVAEACEEVNGGLLLVIGSCVGGRGDWREERGGGSSRDFERGCERDMTSSIPSTLVLAAREGIPVRLREPVSIVVRSS